MGMFDYLCIDNAWLPKDKQVPYEEQDFQTKSFDCTLDSYEILKDGRLFRTSRRYEADLIEGGEVWEPVDYTGEICFYSYPPVFKAWCVNGMVQKVVDVSETKNPLHVETQGGINQT